MIPPRLFILASSLLIALGAGACDRSQQAASGPAPRAEPVRVLTTIYALGDVARQIGGDRVTVEWFIESGQPLGPLRETPERRNQFRNADLVITRGAIDPWTLSGSGNTYQDRRILRIDGLPSGRDTDPTHHAWLDPRVALELSDELVTRLSTLDPRGAATFQENARQFRAEVIAASDAARPALDGSNGRFLALDRGFWPLARRFGLSRVELPDLNLSDPSTYGVHALQQAAREAGAKGIFVSSETPLALLRDWEARLGLKVLPLDPVGSSAPSGRSTYAAVLRYNLAQLVAGLEGTTRPTAPATTTAPVTDPGLPTEPPDLNSY